MLVLSLIFISTLGWGNATADKARVAFEHADQLRQSARYEESLLEFQEIERIYPYSSYVKKARLSIADIYFDMANYIQAEHQYQYYTDLYPQENNSDYALFRSGLSQFKQLPRTIDRDLAGAGKVLKTWRSVLVKFPKSKFTNKILEKQKEVLNMLGKKELYIASFYLKKKKYISAQARFNKLFKKFPAFKSNTKALEKALTCAKALEDSPLIETYSAWLKKAKI